MKLTWIVAAFLFSIIQPLTASAQSFFVIEDGNEMTSVSREYMTLPIPGPALVDPKKYVELEAYVNKLVSREPINAKIAPSGEIIPAIVGQKLNKHAFAERFYSYFYSNGPREVDVPIITVYPKVDSELLSLIRVKRIGQYVTFYNARKTSRANNILRAVEAIDSYVIFPGEKFSFNKVVGQRTEAKGYMKAPEILKGKLIEGIGGGICQVSSTLFNAVDSSGMTIVERYSHSKHVPYVPKGRDATVSWWGPDFVFENNYNQPVLIRAHAAKGRVVVILYSSDIIQHTPRIVPGFFQEVGFEGKKQASLCSNTFE